MKGIPASVQVAAASSVDSLSVVDRSGLVLAGPLAPGAQRPDPATTAFRTAFDRDFTNLEQAAYLTLAKHLQRLHQRFTADEPAAKKAWRRVDADLAWINRPPSRFPSQSDHDLADAERRRRLGVEQPSTSRPRGDRGYEL